MKGYRFYLEYATPQDKRKGTVKRPGPHLGIVVAVKLDTHHFFSDLSKAKAMVRRSYGYDGLAAVSCKPNSPVRPLAVADVCLAGRCRRIPERLAREIHPALFEYLVTRKEKME